MPRELLSEYGVHYVKYVYVDGDLAYKSTPANPIFGYDFPSGTTKFYRPLTLDRTKKWSGSATATDINGLYQLP